MVGSGWIKYVTAMYLQRLYVVPGPGHLAPLPICHEVGDFSPHTPLTTVFNLVLAHQQKNHGMWAEVAKTVSHGKSVFSFSQVAGHSDNKTGAGGVPRLSTASVNGSKLCS